jgi:hypothetical protein
MEVSNETLLEDLKNTEYEYHAYWQIRNGFKVLSELPENKNEKCYYMEYLRYEKLIDECGEFLEALRTLKKERNLPDRDDEL